MLRYSLLFFNYFQFFIHLIILFFFVTYVPNFIIINDHILNYIRLIIYLFSHFTILLTEHIDLEFNLTIICNEINLHSQHFLKITH